MEYENPLLQDAEGYPESIFVFKKTKGCEVVNGYKAKDLMELRFLDVELIKDMAINPSEENIKKSIDLVYGLNYNKLRLLEFYKAYNYIIDKIKTILQSEKALSTEPSQRLINAGIERMQIFGSTNIIDDIAKRYSQPPHEVEKWSYGWVFTLSLKMKYESDIQRRLDNEK